MDLLKPPKFYTTGRQERYLSVRLQNHIQHWTEEVTTTKEKHEILVAKCFLSFIMGKPSQRVCEGGGRQDQSKTFTQKQSKQDRDNREDVWEKLEKSKLDSDSSGDADMLKVNLAKDGQD